MGRWNLRLGLIILFQVMCATCSKNSSLTFVIDDTYSMHDDITQVREAAGAIMDIVVSAKASEIENVVLVTFNDVFNNNDAAQHRKTTSRKEELIEALNEIEVHGGGDCPEYSLTGIKLALEESKHGSYLFVFTDAGVKDLDLLNEVKSLSEKKESQVIFIVTYDDVNCKGKDNQKGYRFNPYYEIAKASSGQVFRVNKDEVKYVVEIIKHTLNDKKAVLKTTVVPPRIYLTPVLFTMDDKTEYAIISSAGHNVELVVTDTSVDKKNMYSYVEIIMWRPSGKVVKFYPPSPGNYCAWVRGETEVSIVIYARTDFTFEHGFSKFEPKSLSDTSKQPIANGEHHLSISVVDPYHTVDIQTIEILNMNEEVIMTMPLKKANNGNFYITDTFVSPQTMFKIQVTGTVKKTGRAIRRISKTAIEPQIPPPPASKPPNTNIFEGSSVDVDYDGGTTLTCTVSGYPRPEILWTTKGGSVLSRVSHEVEPPYKYISYLKLDNIKYPGEYYCRASNKEGSDFSMTYVKPRSPFNFGLLPAGTIISKYGAKTDITCRVQSSFPYKIKWYRNKVSKLREIHPSDKHTISSTGATLHIHHTDINDLGKYVCEASLVNDKDAKRNFTTDVKLGDLSPPVLQGAKSTTITVQDNDRVTFTCKIASGTPPPVVSWQVMKRDDKEYKDIPNLGQELTVNSVTLRDAGKYRCHATNKQGRVHKTTEVVVHKAPEVYIQEGSNQSVAYGNSTTLLCKIVGVPLPNVGWKDSKGNALISKNNINNHEITSKLNLQNVKANDTYFCFAVNELGKRGSHIDLSVTSPFIVLSQPEGTTISNYGAKTDITCRVQSSFPFTIRWYRSIGSKIKEIIPSKKYTVSPTGDILHIQPTDINAIGKYTCEASLDNDMDAKLNFTTDVQLGDLSPPVILDAVPAKKTVLNNARVIITCKIASGTPPPIVNWQVKRNGDKEFENLPDSGQELTIDSATLRDTGQYRCNATNTQGHAFKTTELIVKKVPEVSIDEGPTVKGTYGRTTELNCRAVAYPPPEIVWRDNEGRELSSKNTINNNDVLSMLIVQNTKTSETQYTCIAQNNMGTRVASVLVTVSSPIVFPKHLPETTSVNYGAPSTINCDVKSSYDMTIKWFYQKTGHSEKTEIHPSDKYMISRDKRELFITNVDLDVVGKYTCEASLVSNKDENTSSTTTVKINNLRAPEITYSNSTVTVMNGHKLLITCKSTGIPKPTTTWQVKVKDSDKFENKEGFGQDFINSKISYEWAGLYKCTAASPTGTDSRTIEVIVHGKPSITNSEFAYFGVTGDRALNIPCEVTGVPEPSIIWKHGNKVVTSGPKIAVIKNSIVIKNPTEKDSSNFTCEAKNVYGNATANFEAVISDFDVGDTDSDTIYLKPGESKDIKCRLTYSDPQSVRWFVNGENSNVNGTFYYIKDAKFENDGNYTCRVNNDHGSESLNYVVDVGYKPMFKSIDLPTTYLWDGGQEDSLDCSVHAKPNEKVEWVLNGKPLNYKQVYLPISGWGIYSCNVSNYHGSVQHTYNVTSDGCLINRTAERIQNTPLILGDEPLTWPQFDSENSNEFVTVRPSQTVTLQCSTIDQPQNHFKTHPNYKMIVAECFNEDKFIVEDKTYSFEDLQCKHDVKPSLKVSNKTCMKSGETIEIGFKLNNGFLGVYEVCYSNAYHKTLFTKVVMSNVNLGNKVESTFQLNEGIKTGKKHDGKIIKCHYNQRWLVNPVDVAFGPAQTATLSNKLNAVPVYEPCDSSRMSWSKVEFDVQMKAFFEISLTVWTGASGYASDEVPGYLWKVVKFSDTFESIVYVNSPDAEVKSVCSPKSSSEVLESSDMYTYSCNMEDFLQAFNLPKSDFGI